MHRDVLTYLAEWRSRPSRKPLVIRGARQVGKTGSLRSLHLFCSERNAPLAVRFNMDLPSLVRATGKLPTGKPYDYHLLSLPCYMVGQCRRLIRDTLSSDALGNVSDRR